MKRYALLSVTNKTRITDVAKCFVRHNIQIISSGGTYSVLKTADIQVTEVSEYTGAPELYDGRVKTLHPKVQGGMLFERDNQQHVQDAEKHNHGQIDFVVCNLYQFEEAIRSPHITLDQAIEKIDIGGPTNIRAAAKNYKSVTVLCNPIDYSEFIRQMDEFGGTTTEEFRLRMAYRVFVKMADYECAIRNYLEGQPGVLGI